MSKGYRFEIVLGEDCGDMEVYNVLMKAHLEPLEVIFDGEVVYDVENN